MKFEANPGDEIEIKITTSGKAPRVVKMTVGDNYGVKVEHSDNQNIRFRPLDDRRREEDR
jgi:hypothetical protein